MVQRNLPFDPCAVRHLGSPESDAAWRLASKTAAGTRAAILAWLRQRGDGTAKEFAAWAGVQLHKISGRFSELRHAGQIARTGIRRDGSAVCRIAIQA